jgi:hypothetical protein
MAGNPIHIALILIVFPLLLLLKRKDKTILTFTISILAAFILYCFMLRWQPWCSRLHLPLFVLSAPLLAVGLSMIRSRLTTVMIVLFMCITAVPWLFLNQTRQLIGKSYLLKDRQYQYFTSNLPNTIPYINCTVFLNSQNVSNIGLIIDGDMHNDEWEYPLWPLLNKNHSVRMEHILVQNVSAKKSGLEPFNSFMPEVIVVANKVMPDSVVFKAKVYRKEWGMRPLGIFTP